MTLHPLVEAAARGELPEWTEAHAGRRAHMARVADLVGMWADALGLGARERRRWRALAYLHDSLRDADPECLRPRVPPDLSDLPGLLLHGPAAAERIRVAGVTDGPFLMAIRYHTLGHPGLERMGRALYAGDFLDPGRDILRAWRAELRARMPGELGAVVREICAARISHLISSGTTVRRETAEFWNTLAVEG